MAIQWMDDFNGYGTDGSRVTRMLDGVYAEQAWTDLVVDPDPNVTGKRVMQVQTNSSSYLRRVLSSNQTTVGLCQRLWLTSLPSDSSQTPQWGFNDVNNNQHIYCVINPTGYIDVYRREDTDVLLGSTSGPVVTAGAWKHYETKVVMSNTTTGSVQIWVEGVSVLNLTGVRTMSTRTVSPTPINSIANIYWRNGRSVSIGPNMHLKDVIVWDGTGTRNNSQMGSCQVYQINPNADSALGWTPNTGTTGYNLVNEVTPDDDTTYINAPYPPPSPTTFGMTDLPVNITSVRGVQIIHRSRKTDGGDGNIQTAAITTGGTSTGTDRPVSSAYTYWWDVFDAAPGGGSWNKTLVDGMTVRINRTL